MHYTDFFLNTFIFLAAAVISVPIARKLGMGSVLGYLFAGIVIGPYVLGLVGNESEKVMHFAEFGVVLMLFVIGLELQPSVLWKMRRAIFGLGGMQVLVTALIIAGFALFFGFRLNRALAIGLILALSSTAIVLQTLSEKGLLKNTAGQTAFSVLLFQDISVLPILAIIPVLSMNSQAIIHESELNEITGFVSLQGWLQLLIIVGAIALIIVGGRFIARYFFRLVAETGMHEIFTAMALLLVVGIALLMNEIGLSPAMGTFLAGVVLADNEYRHELESVIDPFKGLLLGLFFITVGASINFSLFLAEPVTIVGFTLLLITIKFIVLLLLGRMFKLRKGYDYLFAFLLAQSSEFAFVLITFSQQNLLFDSQTSGMLILVVTLSMALSPVLLIINEKAIAPILSKMQNKMEAEWVDNATNPVIIAGFGRFGLAVGRLLLANRIKVTIIDSNPTNVEVLRKFGFKLFYGDVTRHEVLERAGVKNARLIILSMAEYDEAVKVASYLRKKYPRLKIMARAKDIYHTFEFFKENVTTVQNEVFASAADLGEKALVFLGHTPYEAYRAARTFKHHEKQVTEDLYKAWKEDESRFIQDTRRFSEQLAEILEAEKGYGINDEEYSWDNQNNGKSSEDTPDEKDKPPGKQDLDFF